MAINTIAITLKKFKTIKEKLENTELQIAKKTATNDKATIKARSILTSTETRKIIDISII